MLGEFGNCWGNGFDSVELILTISRKNNFDLHSSLTKRDVSRPYLIS